MALLRQRRQQILPNCFCALSLIFQDKLFVLRIHLLYNRHTLRMEKVQSRELLLDGLAFICCR